jgi:hypothetical protein
MCGFTVSPINKVGVFLNHIHQVYMLQTSDESGHDKIFYVGAS